MTNNSYTHTTMDKKYWLLMKSNVYADFKEKQTLLYDTDSGKCITLSHEAQTTLIKALYEDLNLGSVEVSSNDLLDAERGECIRLLCDSGMARLIAMDECPVKPVSLLPILSLNKDVDKLMDKEEGRLLLSKDITKYLLDVNIQLTDHCPQSCSHCSGYCKQFSCCSQGREPIGQLPADGLESLLRQVGHYPVRTINITGGDIYTYKHLDLFSSLFAAGTKMLNFYVNYLNYRPHETVDCHRIHVLVNTPLNTDRLKAVIEQTRQKDVHFHAIVEDGQQYEAIASILEEAQIEDFQIHPFYNGNNIDFFKENVYLSKEDIESCKLSIREIFRNQKMNANFFGSLYFYPDGTVRANPNSAVIGNIMDNEIIDIIFKEMIDNTAWRKVRDAAPCSRCVYQFICPPLSNYELAIGKCDLCTVNQQ